jgi:hypothetical protein
MHATHPAHLILDVITLMFIVQHKSRSYKLCNLLQLSAISSLLGRNTLLSVLLTKCLIHICFPYYVRPGFTLTQYRNVSQQFNVCAFKQQTVKT